MRMDQEPDIGEPPPELSALEQEEADAGDAWEYWHQRARKAEAALLRLEKLYNEEVADLEELKARGDLTKDYGEHSLYHARKGLERVRAALSEQKG